jgi:hypothetical protein
MISSSNQRPAKSGFRAILRFAMSSLSPIPLRYPSAICTRTARIMPEDFRRF